MTLRKHVSAACERCRQRRKKCSGDCPCTACLANNAECSFPSEGDGRRHEVRKRRIDELQSDSDILTGLIESMQDSEDDQFGQLVSLIRSNAPLDELKLCIKQQLIASRLNRCLRSPELEGLHDRVGRLESVEAVLSLRKAAAPSGRRVLSIARLTDSPPYKIPASPWTTVTGDDALVSNLISVWLTWDRPFYNWIDQDLFLRDMQQGQVDSPYCSPFLVNAILAHACSYSDYHEARATHGAMSTLMAEFLDEAKRLLAQETTESPLTKAQGLAFLFIAVSVAAQDGLGYSSYLKQAIELCQELETQFAAIDQSDSASEDDQSLKAALSTTCWGIFNVANMTALTLQEPSPMSPPKIPVPKAKEDQHGWITYPKYKQLDSAYINELLHHHSLLSLLCRDILELFYETKQASSQKEIPTTRIFQLYEKLLSWRSALPPHLLPNEQSPASVFTHYLLYQTCLLILFAPVKQHIAVSSADKTARLAQKLSRDAAFEVLQTCRLYTALYGNAHMCVFFAQPVLLAALEMVDQEDLAELCIEITDLCIFFRAMSRRFPWAMAALRMLQQSVHQRGKVFPPRSEKLFEEFESQDWMKQELQQVISLYPVLGDAGAGTLKTMNMGDFLEMMSKLDVDRLPVVPAQKEKSVEER